jgi:tetratricopeptide (TPR) repeat protein
MWSRLPPRSHFYARTTQYRNERAVIFGWTLLLLLAGVLLAGFAVLVGYEAYDAGGKGTMLVSKAPVHAFLVTLTHSAVALPIAFGMLIGAAWSIRNARLAALVWRGGPVLVSDFDEGSDLASVKAPHLTARFRERLAVLRLQAATPSPGAAPEGAFLDTLSSGEGSAVGVLGPLLRLLRAAVPTYAIQVHGVVREREESKRYGVTVQVVQIPSQSSAVIEVWETSWERAIRRAADEATAAILPRSRLCRGTWSAWRGYVMPEGLLSAYESAAKLEQERRFDEALDQYWEALRLDPTNLSVRLRLGQLQEKAGLLLAALVSYQRILAFANPGAKNLPRGMYRRGARRDWDQALSIAKYRAVVLLGEGSILREWSTPTGQETKGDRHLQLRAETLRAEIETQLKPLADMPRRDPAVEAISRAIGSLLEVGEQMNADVERDKRGELMSCAREAALELELALPRLEMHTWRQLLTRRTVALAQLSIDRRRDLLRNDPPKVDEQLLRELDGKIKRAGWRPGLLTGWWPTWTRRWQWQEHYNAACVYAVHLDRDYFDQDVVKSDDVRRELAQRAIKRLEQAITMRDSEFVVTWRDWVVSEDRALDRLRQESTFRSFETMYFPSENPVRDTIKSVARAPRKLVESRYTRDLLAELARSRHETWHTRAGGCRRPGRHTRLGAHALSDWCEEEREIWGLLSKVTADGYDWRVRHGLLARANELLAEDRQIVVRFGRYDETTPPQDGKVDDAELIIDLLKKEHERADRRLARLAAVLNGSFVNAKANSIDFERWTRAMCDHDGHDSLPVQRKTELCTRNAAVWDKLSQWLCAEEHVGATQAKRAVLRSQDAFLEELEQTANRWSEAVQSLGGSNNGTAGSPRRSEAG